MPESELFEKGLEVRREVLGADFVDADLTNADEFMMGFQRVVTEWAWGYVWSRLGLDRRTRSMLNLAILTALEPDGVFVVVHVEVLGRVPGSGAGPERS